MQLALVGNQDAQRLLLVRSRHDFASQRLRPSVLALVGNQDAQRLLLVDPVTP